MRTLTATVAPSQIPVDAATLAQASISQAGVLIERYTIRRDTAGVVYEDNESPHYGRVVRRHVAANADDVLTGWAGTRDLLAAEARERHSDITIQENM
jgi:hypothetical protein